MAMRQQNSTVVGVFDDHDDARAAIRDLKAAGFREDQIGVASSSRGDARLSDEDTDADDDNYAGEGALAGAATGAGIGALWGLGILAGVLPAIGPAIAGGTLAVLLSSAAAGAAAAGLGGALIGMGMSKEEAEYYESELKSGRTIVTVTAESRASEARSILSRHGGYDMSTRTSSAESAARTGALPGSPMPATTSSTAGERRTESTHMGRAAGETIQAHEEKLRVHKTPVEGEVKVRKETHTEHKQIDVPVTREEVVIERHAGSGREVSSADLKPGQEIRVPVKQEEVNVEKQTVISEEVSIGKRKVQDIQHVDENLRKENIKVETRGDVRVDDQRNKGKQ